MIKNNSDLYVSSKFLVSSLERVFGFLPVPLLSGTFVSVIDLQHCPCILLLAVSQICCCVHVLRQPVSMGVQVQTSHHCPDPGAVSQNVPRLMRLNQCCKSARKLCSAWLFFQAASVLWILKPQTELFPVATLLSTLFRTWHAVTAPGLVMRKS